MVDVSVDVPDTLDLSQLQGTGRKKGLFARAAARRKSLRLPLLRGLSTSLPRRKKQGQTRLAKSAPHKSTRRGRAATELVPHNRPGFESDADGSWISETEFDEDSDGGGLALPLLARWHSAPPMLADRLFFASGSDTDTETGPA